MKPFNVNIYKRTVRKKHRNGRIEIYDRFILNFNDPSTGKRKEKRCKTRKEAEARRQELYAQVAEGGTLAPQHDLTVANAVAHWLKNCEGRVARMTFSAYRQVAENYIVGPALVGTKDDRRIHTFTGKAPVGASWLPMLGGFQVSELTTGQIRAWHQTVLKISTPYVARLAKKHLSTVLAMSAEDFSVRVPAMPKNVSTGYRKKERILLRQDQIKTVLDAAAVDKRHGLYYAFPFLTGVRPGEMLGLLWEDVDFVANTIRIRRNQDERGNIKPFPKTVAGQRTIPLVPMLREMLLEWKDRCPTRPGFPHRVFPALGFQTREPGRQIKAGGPLLIHNFRSRIWMPMLKRLGLPNATPYAARHLVISNLQAQGVEIGMVARIAGHANPQVTLQHYTHKVRDSAGVMEKLNAAYGLS